MTKVKNYPQQSNLKQPLLREALEYKDLEGMMKPRIHIDEFASKMGDDDDIIVISFFVRSESAARDLVNWFEKGYDWVLDADQSPGEIRPGRYLVYIEMRRRSSAGTKVAQALDDLSTLTEFNPDDWEMHYDGAVYPFSQQEFDRLVPLSPKEYRRRREQDLNEMRKVAGIDQKTIYEIDPIIKELQSIAGI